MAMEQKRHMGKALEEGMACAQGCVIQRYREGTKDFLQKGFPRHTPCFHGRLKLHTVETDNCKRIRFLQAHFWSRLIWLLQDTVGKISYMIPAPDSQFFNPSIQGDLIW